MSSGSVRRVSREDIQLVQNLIERCLQLYMNQKEVVETLLEQAKIEPGFTELVWQKLEEENREFFNAYNLRLMVKQQIIEFNRLLEQQAQMMHRIHPSAVSSLPNSNGVHAPPMLQNPACYAPEQTSFTLKQEDVHHSMASNLANAFSNGSQNFHSSMHSTINMSDHASRIDASQSMLSTQSASVGLMQGMNGGMIKSEAEYSSRPSYMFGSEENVLETRPPIGNAPFPSFTAQSNRLPLNESILDPDTSTFGFLGLIPQSFSLSDLNSDFSQDILDSYARSPFLATEPDNFLDTGERDHHDSRRLGTMSEALGYEEFGSE